MLTNPCDGGALALDMSLPSGNGGASCTPKAVAMAENQAMVTVRARIDELAASGAVGRILARASAGQEPIVTKRGPSPGFRCGLRHLLTPHVCPCGAGVVNRVDAETKRWATSASQQLAATMEGSFASFSMVHHDVTHTHRLLQRTSLAIRVRISMCSF